MTGGSQRRFEFTTLVIRFGRVRPVLPWVGLACCSCSASIFIEAPAELGLETVILVSADLGAAREVRVFRTGSPLLFEREFEAPPRFLWLGYVETPEALRLDEGLLTEPGPTEPGRDAIEPDQSFLSSDGAAFAPITVGALDDERLWQGLRFPPFGPFECLQKGGCPRTNGCQLPCNPMPFQLDDPELPRTDCPEGWTAGLVPGLSSIDSTREPRIAAQLMCRPTFPADECGPGTAAFGTTTSCESLGDCALDWATNLPADAVFVRAGAAAGGDGSRLTPFADLSEAWQGQPAADHYAIHGQLELDVTMSWRPGASVSIRGACAERDGLSWRDPGFIVLPESGEMRILGLSLQVPESFQPGHVLLAVAGTRFELENVDLTNLASSETIVIQSSEVVLTRVRARAPAAPRVLLLQSTSSLQASQVVLEGSTERAVHALREEGAAEGDLRLQNVTIRSPGAGIESVGYTVTATALALFATTPLAFEAAPVALFRVYAQPTRQAGSFLGGAPVGVFGPARISGLSIETIPDAEYPSFVFVLNSADARLEDLILDARGAGNGLLVQGSRLQGSRILVANAESAGMEYKSRQTVVEQVVTVGGIVGVLFGSPDDEASVVTASDVLAVGFGHRGIRDTSPPPAEMQLKRLQVRDGSGVGIALRGPGTTTLQDVVARDIATGTETTRGPGSCVNFRGSVQASRLQLRDCEVAGVFLEQGFQVEMESLSVENAQFAVLSEEPELVLVDPWLDAHLCSVDHILGETSLRPVTAHTTVACE